MFMLIFSGYNCLYFMLEIIKKHAKTSIIRVWIFESFINIFEQTSCIFEDILIRVSTLTSVFALFEHLLQNSSSFDQRLSSIGLDHVIIGFIDQVQRIDNTGSCPKTISIQN